MALLGVFARESPLDSEPGFPEQGAEGGLSPEHDEVGVARVADLPELTHTLADRDQEDPAGLQRRGNSAQECWDLGLVDVLEHGQRHHRVVRAAEFVAGDIELLDVLAPFGLEVDEGGRDFGPPHRDTPRLDEVGVPTGSRAHFEHSPAGWHGVDQATQALAAEFCRAR